MELKPEIAKPAKRRPALMKQPAQCDHVIAYDKDIYDGTSMLAYLSFHRSSDAYDTDFRYCPMCGECIRDEQGRLIVGEAWEAGEDENDAQ